MKKFNKKLGILGWVLLFAVFAMGAKIGGNFLRVGDLTGTDVEIQMGEGRLKWDSATSKMQFSNDSGSSIKDIGSGGGAGSGINLLSGDGNADFETGNPPANWTASGSSTFVQDIATQLFDVQSGVWDASAASENLDSNLFPVPVGLEGNQCIALINYKWEAGAAGDIALQALDSGGSILAAGDLDPTTGQVREGFVVFTCPTAESVRLRLTSTANAAAITIDNAHLGSNIREINVASSELALYAKYETTSACTWTKSGAAMEPFSTDTDCPAISVISSGSGIVVDTTDDDLPTLELTTLPPGKYELVVDITGNITGANAAATFSIRDSGTQLNNNLRAGEAASTNTWLPLTLRHSFVLTTTGSKSFDIGCAVSSGSCQLDNRPSAAGIGEVVWTLKRYPLDSEKAILLSEANGWHVDANIGGGNPSLGTAGVSAYAPINNAGLDLVLRSGSAPAEIGCASGTAPTGLTCGADESVAVAFTPPFAGKYEVCGEVAHSANLAASGSVNAIFQWIETGLADTVVGQLGGSRISSEPTESGVDSAVNPLHICGTFEFASVGKKLIRLMYEQSTNATVTSNLLLADRSATFGQRDIHITVRAITQNFPMPVILDTVVNPGNVRQTKIFGAMIEFTGGTPLLIQEQGSWIDSLTDVAVGRASVVFTAGTFTTDPICTCAAQDNATGFKACMITDDAEPSTSQISIENFVSSTGAATDDGGMHLICIGE
jgi:hypothetical protein